MQKLYSALQYNGIGGACSHEKAYFWVHFQTGKDYDIKRFTRSEVQFLTSTSNLDWHCGNVRTNRVLSDEQPNHYNHTRLGAAVLLNY